ncbi:MAG: tRNA (guanosine(46)-N7)-methyltransferase TrmB [Cyclobacteriaceae bacterium]|nr:tRNA (guanosine(46)-N7)-methyltransferase TrmB [Cyclobacteriaceae bacterium]MCH8516998.1 tRNA (guanosine(46)-N7)-methyltransferase TrmB [Cyclobacteriaceae bacterium]
MRTKLIRFESNADNPLIYEPGKDNIKDIKGNWHKKAFGNDHPITLELACGRGEYTVGLSQVFPERNFIGIDIKGERIWKGADQIVANGSTNAVFLRTHITSLESFFARNEVSEIWIVFPDPRPKSRDARRRLTHPRFLDIYRNICRKGAWVNLKTDNTPLFDFTLDLLSKERGIKDLVYTRDLYRSELLLEHYAITTRYEKLWTQKGENIKFMRFRIN